MTESAPGGAPRVPTFVWVIPLLTAVITPGLTWVEAEKPMAIRVEMGLGMVAGVAAIALGLLLVLSRGLRTRVRWSLSVTAVIVLVLIVVGIEAIRYSLLGVALAGVPASVFFLQASRALDEDLRAREV